jgi:hypothetical protein
MKIPTIKAWVLFLLVVFIACVLFVSPAKAGEMTGEQQYVSQQEQRITVIPEIPAEVLGMMCSRRAQVFSEYFESQQPFFDKLDSLEGISTEQYHRTKKAYIGIEKVFVRFVGFFIIEKADKEIFIKLMEEKVFSQIS